MKRARSKVLLRNFLIILTALTAALALYGADLPDHIAFAVYLDGMTSEELEGCTFDLLLKIEQWDALYTDFNESQSAIPKNSPTAAYSEKGFCSVTAHLKGTQSRIEDGFGIITIPDSWFGGVSSSHDPKADFCEKYRNARAVIVGRDGEMLGISEPFELSRVRHFSPYRMEYHIRGNTVECAYEIRGGIFGDDATVMVKVMAGCSIISVLWLLFFLVNYLRKRSNTGKFPYIAGAALLNLPFIVTTVIQGRLSFLMYTDKASARSRLIECIEGYISQGMAFISIAVLLIFIIIHICRSIASRRKAQHEKASHLA